jgi:hypothetical protein
MALLLANGVAWAQAAPAEERKADHDALRAMLVNTAQALNTRQLDSIAGVVHPGLTVITIDNQKLVSLEALKEYYAGLFEGPTALLTKMETKPVADEVTRFLGDSTGVVYGASDDVYHFRDGDVRNLKTRWSAVVAKEGETWKLVNVHFSTNLLDNPMLDATKAAGQKIAIAAGVVGLVLGALLMALLRRRSR